jgi:hypothetical protein
LPVVSENEFSDPKVGIAKDAPNIAPAADALARVRILEHSVLSVDLVLHLEVVRVGRSPVGIQGRSNLAAFRLNHPSTFGFSSWLLVHCGTTTSDRCRNRQSFDRRGPGNYALILRTCVRYFAGRDHLPQRDQQFNLRDKGDDHELADILAANTIAPNSEIGIRCKGLMKLSRGGIAPLLFPNARGGRLSADGMAYILARHLAIAGTLAHP